MSNEELWKSYQLDLDLYKFYLDLVVKVAAFFFTLAGGVVAYSLANYEGNEMVLAAPLLPVLVATALSLLCSRGAVGARGLHRTHGETADALGIREHYDLSFLPDILRLFVWVYAGVAVIIAALFLGLMLVN